MKIKFRDKAIMLVGAAANVSMAQAGQKVEISSLFKEGE